MDQDSSKNKTQSPASTTGPIPSGVGVIPPTDTASTPTTPPTTIDTSTSPQQPASGGGLSMGFSMNPPATAPTMESSQSPLQIDTQEPPKSDPLTPTATPPPIDPGYTQTKSHRMTYIFIFLAIIIVVSLIVLFFYRQYMNITGQGEVTPTVFPQITKVTSPTATPTVTPVNAEEADLQKINIENIDKELQDIETDVNQLNASPTTIR